MKMYDMASRAAVFLVRETGMDQSKTDRVRFGLELILGEIVKLAILVSLSALMGLLPGVLAAMAGFSLLRLVSGGGHCEDYWRCLVFSILVLLVPSWIGVLIAPLLTGTYLVGSMLIGLVIMAAFVILWAPGDVPQRKIKQEEKKLFKGLSLVFLVVWITVLSFFIMPYSIAVAVAGFLGAVAQTFTFSPVGYRALNRFDIVLSRIIGERRCTTHAENA